MTPFVQPRTTHGATLVRVLSKIQNRIDRKFKFKDGSLASDMPMDGSRELSLRFTRGPNLSGQNGFSNSRSTFAPALWTVLVLLRVQDCWCCCACKAGRSEMSAMDTSEGGAGEEKKDGPAPPRFEIKKWNAVRPPRPKRCACRARARVEWPRPAARRSSLIDAPPPLRARRRDPTRPLKTMCGKQNRRATYRPPVGGSYAQGLNP